MAKLRLIIALPLLLVFTGCLREGIIDLKITGLTQPRLSGEITDLREDLDSVSLTVKDSEGSEQHIQIHPFQDKSVLKFDPDMLDAYSIETPGGIMTSLDFSKDGEVLAIINDQGSSRLSFLPGARFLAGEEVSEAQLQDATVPEGRRAVRVILQEKSGKRSDLETGSFFAVIKGEEVWKLAVLMATVPEDIQLGLGESAFEEASLQVDWIAVRFR